MEGGYEFGLLLGAAGLPALALVLALAAAWRSAASPVEALRAASIWAVSGCALFAAAAAVTGTAETMNLRNVVLAQENTGLYLLHQPAAGAVFLVALVLGADERSLRGVFLPGRAGWVLQAVLLAGGCLLGAVLFLGGARGPALPGPFWLALKAAVLLGLFALMRRRFAALDDGPRLALAAGACLVALLNLAVTALRAAAAA